MQVVVEAVQLLLALLRVLVVLEAVVLEAH
jgi:hypothetical protein